MNRLGLFCLLSMLLLTAPLKAEQRPSAELIRPVLKQLTEAVILPLYNDLERQSITLKESAMEFCGQVDARGLESVRESWAMALMLWQQANGLLFGPATEDGIDFTIYFRPVKKSIVNGLLTNVMSADALLTVADIEQAGVGGQGLAALEYLLFDREKSEAEQMDRFDDSYAGRQRCAYLVAAAALLEDNIRNINRAWQPDGGNYAGAFYTAGLGSAYFTETYQPLELLINRIYQAAQSLALKKLGAPLGTGTKRGEAGRVYPYKLEAWRSGYSWQNIQSVLQGIQHLIKKGGINDLLVSVGEEALAKELTDQLDDLLATTLPSQDLFRVLHDNPEPMKVFHKELRQFVVNVRGKLAPALGVQLGFNQNDGD